MSFDVTFHAISPAELQMYIFDVIRNPACAEDRSKKITVVPEKKKIYLTFYTENI